MDLLVAKGRDLKKEEFHDKHEAFTDKAYADGDLLPDRYVFVLTNLCNLRCSFCFQKKDPRKDAMTTEGWISLAKQLPEYARVTMTGGEPLAFRGFKEVFSYVAERFDCNMVSNGLLWKEELVDFVLSYPKFRVLSISIDNIGNTLRDVSPNQWKRAEEMMRYFVKKRDELNSGCVLEAKTVVLDDNAEDLLAIHKYCIEELGCDHHSFQFLKGSPIQHADFMFQFEDILKESHAVTYKKFDIIKQQLDLVRKYNLKTGKVAFSHPIIGSLMSENPLPNISYLNESRHIKGNYMPCKFPWSSVHINVDGNLFPCMAVSMGNVKETPLRDIIFGEQFTRFKRLIRDEGTVEGCNRCGWLRPIPNLRQQEPEKQVQVAVSESE
ncbi:radical SAM protein [Candidatus Woesearchaeota archaeon]|nr:radical SAM protein [Candidatus Woesearchaeota archaeon]